MLDTPHIQALLLVGNAMLLLTWYFLLLNKVSKHILMIYFWIHICTYGAITALFLFEDTFIKFDANPIKTMMFDFTYTNFPLYLLSSACLIGSYILFDYLSRTHEISKIIALSQISIIISTVGYHFLGDRMSTISVISMGIIVVGALISGLTRLSLKHPLATLKEYDRHLVSWSLLNAFFIAIPELITFLCSQHYDPTTREILRMLTKHARGIPFVTVIPLYMNIGVQWFNIMLLYFWIRRSSNERINLFQIFKQHKKLLITLALLHTGYIFCYFTAFAMIENKNIISGIMQLYLPLTMIGGVILYRQRWNKFEAVGMGIIATGCLMSVFTL